MGAILGRRYQFPSDLPPFGLISCLHKHNIIKAFPMVNLFHCSSVPFFLVHGSSSKIVFFLISKPPPMVLYIRHFPLPKYQLVNQDSFICQKTFKTTSTQLATLLPVFRLKTKPSYYMLHITHKTS